ncbi:MAG: lytic murein transglycosylase B [Arenimonas sp.]|jgi:membrane-bound lytic murein transglycosylase B
MLRPLQCIVFLLLGLAAACSQSVKPMPPAPTLAPSLPTATVAAPPAAVTPSVAAAAATAAPVLTAEREAAFVAEAAQNSGMTPAEIRAWLAQARYQQSIINAITRPAEGKPWKDYRPIFLTETRIQQGRTFYLEHRSELDKAAADTGVPAEIIVAIIGVETNYGRITGTYRVLDALYTLGFFYPRREEFFRSELSHLFALTREERLDLATLKGSYAGAMGWGQFMPSSYRNFARDGDGDGRRDLLGSTKDAFASIANYFIGHGWQTGKPAFVPAVADAGAAPFVPENFEAKYSLAELAARGYRPRDAGAPDLPATLLTLEGANGPEHWIGYQNFYVITRYNRSPMYAMAVHQLASEIAAGVSSVP